MKNLDPVFWDFSNGRAAQKSRFHGEFFPAVAGGCDWQSVRRVLPAAPIVKVSDELAAGVSVGAGQADILQKLGEPHSRISGDVERYTYFLQSGGSLKLDFENGHVTQLQKASNSTGEQRL